MGYMVASEDGRCGEDRVDSAPSRRATIVGSILLAFCCAAVAAQSISGGVGEERGLGSPSELLYIDSNGEKQHIHVDNFIGHTQDRATSPPAAVAKAAAAVRVAKKKEAALSGPSSEGAGGGAEETGAPLPTLSPTLSLLTYAAQRAAADAREASVRVGALEGETSSLREALTSLESALAAAVQRVEALMCEGPCWDFGCAALRDAVAAIKDGSDE